MDCSEKLVTESSAKSGDGKKKSELQLSKRCTHLHLQEKGLKTIPLIPESSSLVVLYLFNNVISKIENLTGFPYLASLYLQNNKIQQIENLNKLGNLKKLFLAHNNISVLEGLECLENLEEIHIEKQHIPDCGSLCFDPRTIMSLSCTLKVLNISHNNINTIKYLAPLRYLEVFNASYNSLDDIKEVAEIISSWFHLKDAWFIGNSFSKQHRYRETIILNTHNLKNLDNKNISDITRAFIKRFEQEKLIHGSRQRINLADVVPGLPKNYPPPLQKAVSASIVRESKPGLLDDIFDEKNAVYIAWKALPRTPSVSRMPQMSKSQKPRPGKKRVVINRFPQIQEF